VTTRREIQQFARDTRESLRQVEQLLTERRFDDACDLATQAAGCAGEVENLVHQYVAEHSDSRFASGESERVAS
jgi:hypothetical protein